MRKVVLLSLVAVIGLMAGCAGGGTASPSSPTATLPSPTAAPPTATSEEGEDPTALPATATPSGPATCEAYTLPVESQIPDLDEDDHVLGPDDAPITFIEYADFQCPACAGLSSVKGYLTEKYGDQLQFAYRDLPLTGIHDNAIIAAEAAEAAAAQGKFWEMHDLLYESQDEWSGLSEEEVVGKLVEYAGELDLDTERFETELSEHTYREQIMADYEEYQAYGKMATPTYVVNKVFYPTQQFGGFNLLEPFIELVAMKGEMYDAPPAEVLDPDTDYAATIKTTKGDIEVELFEEKVPTNVNSFAFLAQEGWYDGLDFFFVDHEQVALTGDPTNSGGGLPYAGYTCSTETTPELSFDEAGVLALYTTAPDQNSSSFFITFSPQPDFTGNFTIIGRVTEGMDVAESLTETQPGPEQAEPDSIDTIVIEEQ